MRRWASWGAVGSLTLILTVVTSIQSLERYRDFRSGWPWDLAYNNQWFWALVEGDQVLSVRPINSWGDEGPSIWSRTHLDPIRLLVLPFYALHPDPETLLVAHNVILWLMIPAAFGLVRSETGSEGLALSAAALVPLTPLMWPLLWNDFREMALAMPFILWAIQGYRDRHRGLAALGIIGMLASREEFGIMAATLALLPPKDTDEDIGTTYASARTVVFLGAGWMLFVFFGFQWSMVASNAPRLYLQHFGGPKPGLIPTIRAALDFLVFGLGSWSLLALLAPRFAVLSLPWIWGLSHGRWALHLLADERWHHVRYTAPMVALVVAAGLIGYGRLGTWALRKRGGVGIVAGVWLAAALGMGLASWDLQSRMGRIDWPISLAEARDLWRWIDRVGPEEGVVASYEVTAPLSSRRLLYSNTMVLNEPPSFYDMAPIYHWAFLSKGSHDPNMMFNQGFDLVYRGDYIRIYHRDGAVSDRGERP